MFVYDLWYYGFALLRIPLLRLDIAFCRILIAGFAGQGMK